MPTAVDPRVFIIGDSVILGARDAIAGRLAGLGWQDVQSSAESFHTFDAGPVIDAARAAGQIGDVVIVALGSNDGANPSEFRTWIDGLMEHLRNDRRVYWVNLRQFRDWVSGANAEIDAAKQRWPNLRIIDWWARSTFEPGLVYDDGLHLNGFGQAAMGDLIASTLQSYRAERAAARVASPTTTQPKAQASPAQPARLGDGTPLALWVGVGAAALIAAGMSAIVLARRIRRPGATP